MQTAYDPDVLAKCRIGMPLAFTHDELTDAARAGRTLLADGMLTITGQQQQDRYHAIIQHHAEADDALSGCRVVLTDNLGRSGSIGHMAVFGASRTTVLCFHAGGRFQREVEAAARTRRSATFSYEPVSIRGFELLMLLLAPGEIATKYVAQVRPQHVA